MKACMKINVLMIPLKDVARWVPLGTAFQSQGVRTERALFQVPSANWGGGVLEKTLPI